MVRQVRLFLKGRDQELLQELEKRMEQTSKKLEFEKSALYRDQIHAMRRIFERQMVLDVKGKDQDVFNLFRESDSTGVQVLFIRNGRLLGTDFFFFEDSSEASDNNLLGQALHRIYMPEGSIVPREILLPFEYSDRKLLEDALNKKSKKRVHVVCPQKGRKKELVSMAFSNAKVNLSEQRIRSSKNKNVLQHVKFELKLNRLPEVVEAFDISHLSGTMTVGSMVCWKKNAPSNKDYRKYKITSINGPDDFAREFLSSDPEDLDVEKAVGILTGDHKITEEVGIELGNAVVKTLGLESSSQLNPDNLVQSESTTVEAENPEINIENIREFPELASAAVNAELQKQFQTLNESSKALIVSSLNDLKQFFHEKVSQVLEPLKHPISLGVGAMDLADTKPRV